MTYPLRWLTVGDVAPALLWLLALQIDNATIGLHGGWLALGAILSLGMAAAAIWRRAFPTSFVVVGVVGFLGLIAIWSANDVADNPTITPLFVLAFVPYVAARRCSRQVALVALAAGLACGIGLCIFTGPTPFSSYVTTIATGFVAVVAGYWLRTRRLLNDELIRNTERLEMERDSRVRLAVADERTRIARELHTLIAGNVSAMIIQAEAAALLLEAHDQAADSAMAAAEQTGRDALGDMRRVLGVLRHSGDLPVLAPQPGVGQIYRLVETARATGLSIEFNVDGEPSPLPVIADLSIYRILEEALQDDIVGPADVQVCFTDDSVQLTVRTPAPNGTGRWPTLAMIERATICHGTVENRNSPANRCLRVSLPRTFGEALG